MTTNPLQDMTSLLEIYDSIHPAISKWIHEDAVSKVDDDISLVVALKKLETAIEALPVERVHQNARLAFVYFIRACHFSSTDNEYAKSLFIKSLHFICGDELTGYNLILKIAINNELSIIMQHTGDNEEALRYLKANEEIMQSATNAHCIPISYRDLVTNSNGDSKAADTCFQQTCTLTMFYMGQVYSKVGDKVASAFYFHSTMDRQVRSDKCDKVEWAINCASMSQYLIEQNAFAEARHFLSASCSILNEFVANAPQLVAGEIEQIAIHQGAEISRCWVSYCINLLDVSKRRLVNHSNIKKPPEKLVGLRFPTVNTRTYEPFISSKFCLHYDDALLVFQKGVRWVREAELYFNVETLASEYISLMLDYSKLFELLAFFEDDDERRYRIHKRRVALLKDVVEAVDEESYRREVRQLNYEIGGIYWVLVDIKELMEPPAPQVKINSLLLKCISFFRKVLVTFRLYGDTVTRFPEEDEKLMIMCSMNVARAYTRIVHQEKKDSISGIKEALDCYKYIVTYTDKWVRPDEEEAVGLTKRDVQACKDMVKTLQVKLERLEE